MAVTVSQGPARLSYAEKPQSQEDEATPAPVPRPGKPDLQAVLLHKFDKNHNGMLDPDEREFARQEFSKNRGKREALRARKLARYDENGNGKLDPDERRKMSADRAAHKARQTELFDVNGDGRLSKKERATMRSQLEKERQERRQNRDLRKAAEGGGASGDASGGDPAAEAAP